MGGIRNFIRSLVSRPEPSAGENWYEADPANACDYLAANVTTIYPDDVRIMEHCASAMKQAAEEMKRAPGVDPELTNRAEGMAKFPTEVQGWQFIDTDDARHLRYCADTLRAAKAHLGPLASAPSGP